MTDNKDKNAAPMTPGRSAPAQEPQQNQSNQPSKPAEQQK